MRQLTDLERAAVEEDYANDAFIERFNAPDFPATFPIKLIPVQTKVKSYADTTLWTREDLAIAFEAHTKLATPISPFDAIRIPYDAVAQISIKIVDPSTPEDLSNVGQWLGALCYSQDELIGLNRVDPAPYYDEAAGLGLNFRMVFRQDLFAKYRPEKFAS